MNHLIKDGTDLQIDVKIGGDDEKKEPHGPLMSTLNKFGSVFIPNTLTNLFQPAGRSNSRKLEEMSNPLTGDSIASNQHDDKCIKGNSPTISREPSMEMSTEKAVLYQG